MIEVKCKRCRKDLLNRTVTNLLTSHGDIKRSLTHVGCKTNIQESCLYLSTEQTPEWIQNCVNQESWTKGKLNCPNCNNRIGSFNLINDIKCDCGECVTPPIRIICSKVDVLFDNCGNTHQSTSIL